MALGMVVLGVAAATGCQGLNLNTPPLKSHATLRTAPALPVFALAPADATGTKAQPVSFGGATGAPREEPATISEAAVDERAAREHVVRLVGRALVPPGSQSMANVRDGRVTGTPVTVYDAMHGKRLATAVTFYDGSFAVDVKFTGAKLPVLVTTDLLDYTNPELRATLMAPAVLRSGQVERKVAVTPGSTALTIFLQAVASLESENAGGKLTATMDGLPKGDLKFAALITSVDDSTRENFTRLAESAPELKNANDIPKLREGLQRFIGRLSPKKG